MAIYAVPNPTKEVTIKQPIEKIQSSIRDLIHTFSNYTLLEEDNITNRHRIHVKETDTISKLSLDMGQHLDITLNEVNETTTKIFLEVSRAVGVINQQHEVNRASDTLNNFLTYLSKSISGNLSQVVQQHEVIREKENASDKQLSNFLWVVIVAIIAVVAFMIFKVRQDRNASLERIITTEALASSDKINLNP